MEKWKAISFASGFDVSDHGRVRCWFNRKTKEWLDCPEIVPFAYDMKYVKVYLVTATTSKKTNQFFVHRLVALVFLGHPPKGKPWVCHKDGDPTNNKVGNLVWASPKDNSEDMVKHGNAPKKRGVVVYRVVYK